MKKIIAAIASLLVAVSLNAGDWSLAKKIVKEIHRTHFPDVEYVVTDFGAVPDGTTNSLPAINNAITECSVKGGGKVVLPAGRYFCKGSVIIKSNVNLHFEDGAELFFSSDENDYLPCVLTRWEGTEVFNYSPMIYAYNVMNIAITGKGIINGNGKANFEKWKASQKPDQRELRRMGMEGVPVHERVFGPGHLLRPAMLEFFACNTVLIEDMKLLDGTFWSFHLIGCSDAIVRGVSVDCENFNSDGVDPESCRNMLVEGCYFHTGDDGIAVKAGRDADGWRFAQPTENVVIRNCTFETKSNGLCIGSEISAGVRNIFMEDCNIINAKQGIYFKSNLDRGGYIEKVYVRNIKVKNVDGSLVVFEPDYKSESRHNYPTYMHDIVIENVKAETAGRYGIYAKGFDSLPIENITIRNLSIGKAAEGDMNVKNVKNLTLKKVRMGERVYNETISK